MDNQPDYFLKLDSSGRLVEYNKETRDNCNLSIQAWYLDDDTVIGDLIEVSNALSIIQSEGPKFELELNIRKIEVFWNVIDPRISQDKLFPSNIGRPQDGVKSFGEL